MNKIETQKNGLKTLFLNSPGATSATVQVWFRAGSALEENSNRGIAHFLEHMFFKGTKKRPGAKIAHAVESFGGEINAFTSFDYTCYYINCPNDNTLESLNILLDMVSNPLFAQDELIPERDVVFEEYRRSQDSPQQFAFQHIQKSCFASPYNNPILGTPKTIKSFTRSQLIHFRKKYYNLANCLVIVAADFKEEKIKKIINNYSLPSGKEAVRPHFKVKNSFSVSTHFKDVKMATLNFCIPCNSIDHKFSPAEDIAMSIFAYGESSPLYYSLVTQKGLANSGVGSTMFFNEGGFHNLRLTTPPGKIKQVFKQLERLVKQTIKTGFKKEDLEKIKNQFIASKIYEQESLEYRAFGLGSSYAGHGDINKEAKYIEQLEKVTIDDVNSAFTRIFSNKQHIVMQLPNEAKRDVATSAAKQFQESLIFKVKKKEDTIKSVKSSIDPQVQLIDLKEGIQLLYRHNPLTPTFVLHAYLKGGLSSETAKTNGIFGLISNLLTKGNEVTDLFELKQSLENMSASFNNFTGKNAYGLTMHGLSKDFELLTEHFFNSLLKPSFDKERAEHEKEMSLRALLSRESDPTSKCFEKVSSTMFPNHPYRFNTIGSIETLEKITVKQVKDRHKQHLKRSPLLFTYCGDESLDKVKARVTSFLTTIAPRKNSATPINVPTRVYGVREHLEFDREQTQIFIGVPTFPLAHKQNTILKLLTTYLSGQSSELFVDVRDRKGLCYSVQPVHFKALEAGYWGIYMASGFDKVEAAQEAIIKLLKHIAQKGLSQTEFKRIKKMIKGQEQINIQTNDDYANLYSIPVLHSMGLDWHYDILKQIDKLTYPQFRKGLKEILDQEWNIITAGKTL